MRDFKNIDRLFQEKLKDFEVFPSKQSWEAIDQKLSGKSTKTRFSFWTKISSVAALLILFFTVGTIYLIPQKNTSKNVLSKKNTSLKSDNGKDTVINDITDDKTAEKMVVKSTSKVVQLKLEKKKDNLIVDNSLADDNVEEKNIEKETDNFFSINEKENLFSQSFEKNTIKKPVVTETKFSVATIFAPIFFDSFGSGSGADEMFNNHETTGSSSYSYGVKLAYQLNNKFTLQSGINMINLGHKTNNVYLPPGVAIISLSNFSSLQVLAKSEVDAPKTTATSSSDNEATLNQVFGYVEIPVEIKYNLTDDGKIGVNLVGGFSTLVLNKDEVFVETNSLSQSLGNSNNLRPLNFSGNFGVDIDYSLYKNIFINVSPMLKVQTSTFSKNSNNIQTYYLGVYTGLNYKF